MNFKVVASVLVCTFCMVLAEDFQVINTADEYKYHPVQYDFSRHRYVKFSVKACNDAHINLVRNGNVDNRDTYEIVIGGWANTRSVIRTRRQGPNKREKHGPQVNCDTFKTFWISWDFYGTIRVGTADSVLMFYRIPDLYTIKAVKVSTGWGATGEWKVYNPQFEPGTCCRAAGNEYCILPGVECNLFTQQNIVQSPRGLTYLQSCLNPSLKFDTVSCGCNNVWRTQCEV